MEETNVDIIHCGWLVKKGNFVKTWMKRWFVLTKQGLSYYRTKGESGQGQRLKGTVPVSEMIDVVLDEGVKAKRF